MSIIDKDAHILVKKNYNKLNNYFL